MSVVRKGRLENQSYQTIEHPISKSKSKSDDVLNLGSKMTFQRRRVARFGRFFRGLGDLFAALFGNSKAELLAELSENAPEDATLNQEAKELVSNILNVGDQTVEDVVVSRADMVGVPVDATLEDIMDLAVEKGHSRFPVFDGTLDHIVGVVTVKDTLKARKGNANTAEELKREACFVAPSMPVIEMLVQMRENRDHMAFVVDEFGGIDGLITMEDLIELIVGDIEDEHDKEAPGIERQQGSDRALADAGMLLSEAEEVLGTFLSTEEREEEIDTLGGLVFNILGRIPLRGEEIDHISGLKFRIVEATPRRIRQIEISGLKT